MALAFDRRRICKFDDVVLGGEAAEGVATAG
jgi:hypothetical protein